MSVSHECLRAEDDNTSAGKISGQGEGLNSCVCCTCENGSCDEVMRNRMSYDR